MKNRLLPAMPSGLALPLYMGLLCAQFHGPRLAPRQLDSLGFHVPTLDHDLCGPRLVERSGMRLSIGCLPRKLLPARAGMIRTGPYDRSMRAKA